MRALYDIREVNKYIGETATICDSVFTTRALGSLIFLNLGVTLSKQLLTDVIYKANLEKLNEPEKTYLNKKICVTGKLVLYNDKPQIVLNEAKQIHIDK